MKKSKKTTNYFEAMEEAGKKHGVKVTDMSKRGIRAIGLLSGVERQDQRPGSRILRLILAGLSHKQKAGKLLQCPASRRSISKK